jgi:hypothetical protein
MDEFIKEVEAVFNMKFKWIIILATIELFAIITIIKLIFKL